MFPWERRLVAAARPIARMLDIPLPGNDVLAEVQRLVRNLIAMNEILRDRDAASIRLVMNPDRMVIKEAQRTFTYLNLYGYLTDAVVVNRVFPDEVDGGYFGAWRERQREHLEEVRAGFAPVPVLHRALLRAGGDRAPRCSTGSPTSCSPTAAPADVLHTELTHELSVGERHRDPADRGCRSPSAATSTLKKVGLELIVSVGRASGLSSCPPRWPAAARPGRSSRTARWRSASRPTHATDGHS